MSTTRPAYLKNLLQLNREIPITTEKLKQMGISSFFARNYKEIGWLEFIGLGAYMFPGLNLQSSINENVARLFNLFRRHKHP